jgi:hypothetical protein
MLPDHLNFGIMKALLGSMKGVIGSECLHVLER